jgi:hypothetical protein
MIRQLQHRFSAVYRTLEGNKVRVEMQDAPDLNPGATVQPRKVAVVEKVDHVGPGTVIFGMGTAYLLILEDTITDLNRFRTMEITHYLPWIRLQTVIDPVTHMEKGTTPVTLLSKLPVVREPMALISEQGIERQKILFHTGADVLLGDMIGEHKIQAFTIALGAKRVQTF